MRMTGLAKSGPAIPHNGATPSSAGAMAESSEVDMLKAMQSTLITQYQPWRLLEQKQGNSTARSIPPPGYVCHTCRQPGHWRQFCPMKNWDARPDGKRARRTVETYSSRFHFDEGSGWLRWRLRCEKRWRLLKGLPSAPIPVQEVRRAVATCISGKHERSFEQFSYGHTDLRIFDRDEKELTGDVTIRPGSAIVVRRVPIHSSNSVRPAAAPTAGWNRPQQCVEPQPGALEKELGFLAEAADAKRPLMLTN